MEIKRCSWVKMKNARSVRYHDEEWGVPLREDGKLYELFLLETFQAGLSWECILNKREAFRSAFNGFDCEKISTYTKEDIDRLMQDAGIIRNRAKITAAVSNACLVLALKEEFGSFSAYLWHFTGGKTIVETGKTRSALSDEIAKDMKRRGFAFTGSVTIYSFLQAVGVIFAHEEGCFCRAAMEYEQEE